MNSDWLASLVQASRLPTPPKVARQVIELCHRADVTIPELMKVIIWDPALVAQTWRTLQNGGHLQNTQVSLRQAIESLGLDSVKALALGFHLTPAIEDCCGDRFDLESFWQRSYYCAAVAGMVARQAKLQFADEVFTAGLLYDAGLIAMMRELGGEYMQLVKSAGASRRALLINEMRQYQIDHVEVGAAVAAHWKLPEVMVTAIEHQLNPEEAPATYQMQAKALHLGSIAVDVLMKCRHDVMADEFFSLLRRWFGLGTKRGSFILRTAVQIVRDGGLISGTTLPDDQKEIDQILSEAGSLLLELSARQEQQVRDLAKRNLELKQLSTIDPLTQLWNRYRFQSALDHHFHLAGVDGPPLSLLFVDVDHFKKINDTHGHQTGDHVLVELAELLRRVTPAHGVVARFGGEEFVVLLPETDCVTAARHADLIRQTVAGMQLKSAEGAFVSVTVSIGLATQDQGLFATAVHFLTGADRALYAAKAAGRNCVRILDIKPKVPSAHESANVA